MYPKENNCIVGKEREKKSEKTFSSAVLFCTLKALVLRGPEEKSRTKDSKWGIDVFEMENDLSQHFILNPQFL